MRVGIGEVEITPNRAIELSGFAARTQPSDGILDPICARALYLEAINGRRLLWIHADLIAFHQPFVREFRAWAADHLRLSAENVVLSATHTHSAPATIDLTGAGKLDEAYLRDLMEHLRNATNEAMTGVQQCDVSFAGAPLQLSVDRRKKPTAHTDPVVSSLVFRDSAGELVAIVANYAMHPVALGSINRKISADWCAGAAAQICASFPSRPIVLMTNGAAGNLNPPGEGLEAEAVYAIGRRVADAIVPAIERSIVMNDRLQCISRRVSVPLEVMAADQIDQVSQKHLDSIQPDWVWAKPFREALLAWRRKAKEQMAAGIKSIEIELQLIVIGDVYIVAVNGEMFSRFTQIIRDRTGKNLFVVGYANEAFGYIPTREAYAEGGTRWKPRISFTTRFRRSRADWSCSRMRPSR